MFAMMGVLAEFKRSMIVARVKAGLARVRDETPAQRKAKAKGKQAIGRPKVTAAAEAAVRGHLATGMGKAKVARTLGIGTGTVKRIAAELAAAPSRTPAWQGQMAGGGNHKQGPRWRALQECRAASSPLTSWCGTPLASRTVRSSGRAWPGSGGQWRCWARASGRLPVQQNRAQEAEREQLGLRQGQGPRMEM